MRRFVAALVLVAPAFAAAQEKPVSTKGVPSAVIANARQHAPGARLTGVAKETEDGSSFYEVTFKRSGRTIDVTTTLAGDVTLVEKEIARKELPAAVAKLLDDTYPRAKIRLTEEVASVSGTKETLSWYEVLLVDAKKQTLEVQLAPDGSKVLKVERKKPGEVD